jgi:hypothetical protein
MTTMKDAVDDLLGHGGLSAEAAVDRHFGPDFRQRVNGTWLDRAAFLAGIVDLRAAVERASVTVLDELTDGDRYAERHVIELVQRDGTRLSQEVFVFAQRGADGRFRRIEEASRSLTDGAEQAG